MIALLNIVSPDWVTECEAAGQVGDVASASNITEPIKPHEQRALNFLINEYLLVHGYKLTSNTFADENENQVRVVFKIDFTGFCYISCLTS